MVVRLSPPEDATATMAIRDLRLSMPLSPRVVLSLLGAWRLAGRTRVSPVLHAVVEESLGDDRAVCLVALLRQHRAAGAHAGAAEAVGIAAHRLLLGDVTALRHVRCRRRVAGA